jgi:predicted transcriptional regulator of viral defense system
VVPMRVFVYSGACYSLGIERHRIEGVTVRVYSAAKTVADCFKHRSKVGLEVAVEALRDGWRDRRFTMDELWRCAETCRVANVMRPYLEAVV